MKNVSNLKYFLIGVGSTMVLVFAVPVLGHVDVTGAPDGSNVDGFDLSKVKPGSQQNWGPKKNEGYGQGQGSQQNWGQQKNEGSGQGQGSQQNWGQQKNEGSGQGQGSQQNWGQQKNEGYGQGQGSQQNWGQQKNEGYGQWQGSQQNMEPQQNDNTGGNTQDLERQKKQILNDKGSAQAVKMVQSLIKKLPVGYAASAEIVDALSNYDAIKQEIQAATDFDSLDVARQEFQDAMFVLNDAQNQLRQMSGFAKMEKQGSKELSKLTKKLAQVEKSFSKGKIDATDLLKGARAAVDESSNVLKQAVQDGKSGNVEDAQSEFQDFFDNLGDTWQTVGILDSVSQISKGTVGVEKNISTIKKKIQDFAQKSEGTDFSEALDLLQQASDKVAELKSMIKSKDFEPDDAVTLFEDLDYLRQQIEDSLADVQGAEGISINFFPTGMGTGLQVPMGQ